MRMMTRRALSISPYLLKVLLLAPVVLLHTLLLLPVRLRKRILRLPFGKARYHPNQSGQFTFITPEGIRRVGYLCVCVFVFAHQLS